MQLDDIKKILIAIITTIIVLLLDLKSYQFILLIFSAICGLILFKNENIIEQKELELEYHYLIFIFVFITLFIGLPILQNLFEINYLVIADKFFRAGSLVFGGGHVVLPLLQNEILNSNLIDDETFIFGYGLAQAIPGPLFTFSAFIGTSIDIGTNQILTGILCLIMIFMPSFLLVLGVMPYWDFLRNKNHVRLCLIGINSCVVGLLMAAFLNPILISTINFSFDIALVILASIIIFFLKLPQWLSVLVMGLIGFCFNFYFI